MYLLKFNYQKSIELYIYSKHIIKSIFQFQFQMQKISLLSSSRCITYRFLPILTLIFILAILTPLNNCCVHDQFSANTTKHFLNDLTDKRLLAQTQIGRLRIFVDYSLVTTGGSTQINTIKRATNITANYFYNVINVTRLPRLYFPANTNRICNSITIPQIYVTNGTIGDLGVVCTNQNSSDKTYIAKSTPCAFLESNKRPIWGMMSWNNPFLKFDQVGFQQLLFVGIHEMTHIIGFSAVLYELYPKGNPLVTSPNGDYYLNSSKIQNQIKNFFGCGNSQGFPLEDQDGTLIASHWERKIIGNQYMIASGKKGAYVSRFTLALLDSSGWYESINYTYSESTVWGKNKGCSFLSIDNCDGDQFCQGTDYGCDWQATGIGKCTADPFSGSCKVYKYYTNTICVDQNFQAKNLNSKLNALQRGGSSSRCFTSDFRQQGLNKTKLDNRCYVSVCAATGKYIYIMVGSYVMICRTPGQKLTPPPGLEGSLTCPSKFENYCASKKTCPYHCNKNGACIDGKCLCTGSLALTPSCVDISIFLAPVGTTGGLLNAIADTADGLIIGDDGTLIIPTAPVNKLKQVKTYSINSKCIQGTVEDPIFGECLKCQDVFGCESCNNDGCLVCDNGKKPIGTRCSIR